METFSALLALCVGNSPVPGEFPTQRPVTRSFDAFFDLRLNKRLSKQSWCWWLEMLSCPLWRHCNVNMFYNRKSSVDLSSFKWPIRTNLQRSILSLDYLISAWLYYRIHLPSRWFKLGLGSYEQKEKHTGQYAMRNRCLFSTKSGPKLCDHCSIRWSGPSIRTVMFTC